MNSKRSPELRPARFSNRWFSKKHKDLLLKVVKPLVPNDGRYLEIGVFEGQSFIWMAENIFKNENAKLIGIEPGLHSGSLERLLDNLSKRNLQNKSRILKMTSQMAFPKLGEAQFDLIYIDGHHSMKMVLEDAVHAWRHLRPGGLLVFDDYTLNQSKLPIESRPEFAIDCFLLAYRYELKTLHRDHLVIVQKDKRQMGTFGIASFKVDQDRHLIFDPKQGLTLVTQAEAKQLAKKEQQLFFRLFKRQSLKSPKFQVSKNEKLFQGLKVFCEKNQIDFREFCDRHLLWVRL